MLACSRWPAAQPCRDLSEALGMRWLLPQAAHHLQAKAGTVAQMCLLCTYVCSLRTVAGWRYGMKVSSGTEVCSLQIMV